MTLKGFKVPKKPTFLFIKRIKYMCVLFLVGNLSKTWGLQLSENFTAEMEFCKIDPRNRPSSQPSAKTASRTTFKRRGPDRHGDLFIN
jgi:hypothetical protein